MVDLQRERVWDVMAEAVPLLMEQKTELAAYQDIEFNPDWERYTRAEKEGFLRVYTAREDERLIGYAVFFVDRNMHYQDSLQAKQDVFYVEQDRRGAAVGSALIQYSEQHLKLEGVQVIHHHAKLHTAFGVLLERSGYVKLETILSKRLDRE